MKSFGIAATAVARTPDDALLVALGAGVTATELAVATVGDAVGDDATVVGAAQDMASSPMSKARAEAFTVTSLRGGLVAAMTISSPKVQGFRLEGGAGRI